MKFTNIQADGQITNADPDALGDDFLIDDYLRDRNYILGKCLQAIRSISLNPSTEFQILYGGLVTDAGSGRVNISEGAAIGQDADGNPRLIIIPNLTNVLIPSGWNNNRTIWVRGIYSYKLSSETRQHFNGETYNYVLEDSYVGESDSLDLFTDSDPGSDVVKFGVFKMNGTIFTPQPGKSINLSFNPIPLGGIVEDPFNRLDPSQYRDVNGGSFNRGDAPELIPLLIKSVTSMNASTDRINATAHTKAEGELVKFGFTIGGITALTHYFVRNPTPNDFQVSLTASGSIVNITADGTGEMLTNVEWGFGNGSTTANVPDRRGIFKRNSGVHGLRAKAAGGNYDGGAVGSEGQDRGHGHRFYTGMGTTNLSSFIYGQDTSELPGLTSELIATQAGTPDRQSITSLPKTDGTNGIPRMGNETTPAWISVREKVRIA